MKYLHTTLFSLLLSTVFSQVSTSSKDILESLNIQNELIKNSLVKNLEFKNELLKVEIPDYYFSNVVARSSKTMFECKKSKIDLKSTGTEG